MAMGMHELNLGVICWCIFCAWTVFLTKSQKFWYLQELKVSSCHASWELCSSLASMSLRKAARQSLCAIMPCPWPCSLGDRTAWSTWWAWMFACKLFCKLSTSIEMTWLWYDDDVQRLIELTCTTFMEEQNPDHAFEEDCPSKEWPTHGLQILKQKQWMLERYLQPGDWIAISCACKLL